MNVKSIIPLLLVLFFWENASSQSGSFRTTKNVTYGMVSNLALLLDVHQPAKPNGKAIIFIQGSAWGFGYPTDFNQKELKAEFFTDTMYAAQYVPALVKQGYTVFVINHRFAPLFKSTDIIADCQRAVRFIRFHAKEYKIDPDHIGAIGHSSGANLVAILGTADEPSRESKNPVDNVSSKVQAVVTLAGPFDLMDVNKAEDSVLDRDFMMAVLDGYIGGPPTNKELGDKYLAASPVNHINKGDAPMLIYYSDDDPVIPARHAIAMNKKLKENDVPAKLVVRHKQSHFPMPDGTEVLNWFKTYLQ
ncbi:alpha/beta hydrolase [Terrimonas sp. NA20]|uniref:Alpha/beta hydrolase n=1 Tax=Terrimonas ginsenosidimutans TaxID=2908004 RepID=A0ABS9KKG3_9BACT|nr:alpha/beta hydrolase [Terrimonas ginsenosidimutans]MCG2612823.1 alpha/beta hydrolase [Terrimonas ginsenosidimutans]